MSEILERTFHSGENRGCENQVFQAGSDRWHSSQTQHCSVRRKSRVVLESMKMSSLHFPSFSSGAISRSFPVIIFKDKLPGLKKAYQVSDWEWRRFSLLHGCTYYTRMCADVHVCVCIVIYVYNTCRTTICSFSCNLWHSYSLSTGSRLQ